MGSGGSHSYWGMHLFICYAMHECKISDMKECDAPESNKTDAGTELTEKGTHHGSWFILNFFHVNMVCLATTIS